MSSPEARILIVDDDAVNGRFLEKELTANGCRASWFNNPSQLLARFRKGTYHVGIVDLKMPQMDGLDLFKRLREKDPELGIIILTGYPSVDSALATLKTGGYDYLRKPFHIDEVRVVVHRLLEEKGFLLNTGKTIHANIGRRIKEYRKKRQWTITKLADQTHLSKSLISQIENAKNSPSLDTLVRVARSLKVRFQDLVQDL